MDNERTHIVFLNYTETFGNLLKSASIGFHPWCTIKLNSSFHPIALVPAQLQTPKPCPRISSMYILAVHTIKQCSSPLSHPPKPMLFELVVPKNVQHSARPAGVLNVPSRGGRRRRCASYIPEIRMAGNHPAYSDATAASPTIGRPAHAHEADNVKSLSLEPSYATVPALSNWRLSLALSAATSSSALGVRSCALSAAFSPNRDHGLSGWRPGAISSR